jgi:hypothetical protein
MGTATLTSTCTNLSIGTVIVNMAGVVPEKLLNTAQPVSITADGETTSLITASIVNGLGELQSTAVNTVVFSVSGQGTLLGTTSMQSTGGTATVIMKSTLNTGTATVTATASGLAAGTVAITTTGRQVKLLCTSDRASVTADGTATALITARVCAQDDSLVDTAANSITFSITGQGALAGTTVKNASSGLATVKLVSTMQTGTATVRATSANVSEGSVSVAATGVPVGLFLSANPAYLNADGTSTSLVTARITDINNATVTTASNTVSFGLSGVGSFVTNSNPNAVSGIASVSLKAPLSVGQSTISATSSGLGEDEMEFYYNPGPATKIVTTVVPDTATYVSVGTTVSIKGILQDSNGHTDIYNAGGISEVTLDITLVSGYQVPDADASRVAPQNGEAVFSVLFNVPGAYSIKVIQSELESPNAVTVTVIMNNNNPIVTGRMEKNKTVGWEKRGDENLYPIIKDITYFNLSISSGAVYGNDWILGLGINDEMKNDAALYQKISAANSYAHFNDNLFNYCVPLEQTACELNMVDPLDVNRTAVVSFAGEKPVLSIYYDYVTYASSLVDKNGVEINPETFRIFRLNEDVSRWIPVEGSITDSVNGCVNAELDHFSVYCVQSVSTGGTGTEIKNLCNYPNPFSANTVISFSLDRTSSEVYAGVYSLSGRLIWQSEKLSGAIGSNQVLWDGNDQSDAPVANGTYIYKVTAKFNDSRSEKSGKLVKMK